MSEYVLRKLCKYTFRNWHVGICLIGNLAIPNLWFRCDFRASFLVCNHRSSLPYSTSLGCRRQPSLACHAWNHGKSQKSSPLSQQYKFHCHTWSAGESHYCVNSKGFSLARTLMRNRWRSTKMTAIIRLCWPFFQICCDPIAFILKNRPFQMTRCFQFHRPSHDDVNTWQFPHHWPFFVVTGSPRKGFILRNLDVYLNVRRKKLNKQQSDR